MADQDAEVSTGEETEPSSRHGGSGVVTVFVLRIVFLFSTRPDNSYLNMYQVFELCPQARLNKQLINYKSHDLTLKPFVS